MGNMARRFAKIPLSLTPKGIGLKKMNLMFGKIIKLDLYKKDGAKITVEVLYRP